jgi:hypothetical protein
MSLPIEIQSSIMSYLPVVERYRCCKSLPKGFTPREDRGLFSMLDALTARMSISLDDEIDHITHDYRKAGCNVGKAIILYERRLEDKSDTAFSNEWEDEYPSDGEDPFYSAYLRSLDANDQEDQDD